MLYPYTMNLSYGSAVREESVMFFKKLINEWHLLNRSIYTGERLKENLRALVLVSYATGLLSIVLIGINYAKGNKVMLAVSILTLLGACGCAFSAGVLKNREAAALIPTVFCAVMFTIYTIFGMGEGTAMLFSLLIPTGICYFVSVKYGILLSFYYSLLFLIMFYSPLRSRMEEYYSDAFMMRFPLVFIFLSLFTAIAMMQYHRVSLLEQSYQEELSREVEKQTKVANDRADKLETLSQEIVQTLAVTIDAKDKYTNGHSFRVSRYSMALARSLGWPEEEIQSLGREGLLHDIGKIGVPDVVLNKPGRLTDEEFSIIKSHTIIGDEILNQSGNLREAAQVARHHHERFDGRGYPDHLKGEEIPLHARTVAIADAYDAMRSDRIYRKGLPPETIRGEMIRGSGTQFDPELLNAFLDLMDTTTILDEIAKQDIFKLKNLESA